MNSLSILITYYNEKELLKECLTSILSQLDTHDEILIYDDASKFPAIEYAVKDSRVRVIRSEKNSGPSYGRNALLKEAKNNYVHFHDADDWFEPEWAKKVKIAISYRNADAVFTEVRSYFQDGTKNMEHVLGLYEVADHDSLVRFCIRHFMLVPAGTFKKEFVKSQGGYRTDLWQSEDYEFHVRLTLGLKIFEIIQEPLVSIRLRKESRSRNKIETNTYALEAVMQLKSEVPKAYWQEMSEKAAKIGRELYQLGEVRKAKQAFKVAKQLGPPKFLDESKLYTFLAKNFSPLLAEKFGMFYRDYLPAKFRKMLR